MELKMRAHRFGLTAILGALSLMAGISPVMAAGYSYNLDCAAGGYISDDRQYGRIDFTAADTATFNVNTTTCNWAYTAGSITPNVSGVAVQAAYTMPTAGSGSLNMYKAGTGGHQWYVYGGAAAYSAVFAYITAPTSVAENTATLNASITAEGLAGSYYFKYGTTQYSENLSTQAANYSLGTSAVSANIADLACNTTYYYIVSLDNGIGTIDHGNRGSFTTTACTNTAPTLTSVTPFSGGVKNTPYTIAFADLVAAADENDIDGDPLSFRIESISSGTLTKGGAAVIPGVTLFASGESLEWTPPSGATGQLNAFTVKAWDGGLSSATAAQVVVAVNSPPLIAQSSPLTVNMDEDGAPTPWSPPTITATDADSDPLNWSLATAAAHGSATVSGTGASPSVIDYIPDAGFNGTDYFTIQVSDGNYNETITIKVVVSPVVDGAQSEFIPYTVGGQAVYDHEGSSDPTNGGASVQPDVIDISSCSADGATPGVQPSVLITYRDVDKDYNTTSDASLVMRMRLDANPSENGANGPGLQSYHWDFLIDIDNNGSNDYIIDVNGGYASNKLDQMVLYADRNNNYIIDAGEELTNWPVAGSNASAAQQTTSAVTISEDTSVSCGKSHDFWLDMSIPVDSFSEAGLAYNASVPIGAFYSSSASNTDPLQKDWMGARDGSADTFIGLGGGSIVPATGTLTGTVYLDVDGNRVYEEGNPDSALALQSVELLDDNGNLVASYAASGSSYSLSGIAPGNYRIRNVNDGYASTVVNVTVVSNENVSANIPVQLSNNLTVYVFEDLDGDGQYDAGEPDINGSEIYLDGASSGTITANGYLELTLGSEGNHLIKHNSWNAAYTPTTAIEVTLVHTQGDTHAVYFGLTRLGEVSGVVYYDRDGDAQKDGTETPLSGATVVVRDEAGNLVNSTSSGADGHYSFSGLTADTKYYIEETNLAGYASTSSDRVPVSLPAGSSAIINFGDVPEGKISGIVFSDDNGNANFDDGEQGIPGVQVTIYNNDATDLVVGGITYAPGDIITLVKTDSAGHYVVTLPTGRYRVEEKDPLNFVSVSPNSLNVLLPSSQTVANFADMRQGVLSGMVYNDLNGNGQLDSGEPGVNGVTLQIDAGSPSDVTQGNGSFFFAGLADGSYSLDLVVPTGFVVTTASSLSITVSPTSVNSGLLFGIKVSGSIAGEVFHDLNANGVRDSGESGIGGVTIDISGGAAVSTTTLVNGSFSVSGLTASTSYTVTEIDPANYISVTTNTVSINLDANGAADQKASFADLFQGIVSGVVFEDLNGSGVQDSDERGMVGITVSLSGQSDVVTDNNGAYQFARVSGDGLSLSVTSPSGYFLTTANSPATVNMSTYSGAVDFGLQPGGTVLAYVFSDANSNGIEDAEEGPLSGVVISLTSGEFGTTDSNGLLRLTGIQAAANSATVAAVADYSDTTANPQALTVTAGQATSVSFGKYINIAPWVRDEAITIPEDTAVSSTLLSVVSGDVNGDVVTLSIIGGNSAGLFAIDPNMGAITLSGALDYETTTSYTLTIQARDPAGLLGTGVVTINITDVNEAPVAYSQSVTTAEDIPRAVVLTASDAEGNPLSFTVLTLPTHGILSGTASNLTYIPVANYNGPDSFTFKVNDGTSDSNVATVSITVTPLNDAPLANDQSVTTPEDTAVAVTLSGSDVDGDTLGYIIVTQPVHGTLSGTAANLTYTPAANYIGPDNFTFKVNDGSVDSNVATVSITVTPVNDAPLATPQSLSVVEGTPLTITLVGSDPESEPLVYTIVSAPAHGTLSGSGANLTYTPDSGYTGDDSFIFWVNDGTSDSNVATVAIAVLPLNSGVVAVDDHAYAPEGGTAVIDVIGNDSSAGGGVLTLQSVTSPAHGVVTINADGTISYAPTPGYIGTDRFSYTIRGENGELGTAWVVIDVIAPPTITPPADVYIDANALFTKVDLGTATAFDFQGKPLPVSVVDGITFFWSGQNEAVWQATDEYGLTSYATQRVNVRPLVSFSKDQMVAEGSQVTVKVVLNGPSPSYPLEVPYTVNGTAISPDDHDLMDGIAVIESGTETTITLNTVADGIMEGNETIILAMSDPNTNQGVQHTHTITVAEGNIAPSVEMNVVQSGLDRLTVSRDDGPVVVSTVVTDPNLADTHRYDWSLSNNMLVDLDSQAESFTFDPATLSAGVYEVWVQVTDSGSPAKSNIAQAYIKVVDALPLLAAGTDSDNDGIDDATEGFADTDRDGIPDYLDSVPECNVLPEQGLVYNGYLVEGDPGICLRVGNYALTGVTGGAQLTNDDIASDATDQLVPDTEAAHYGGIFDFIATLLPDEAQSVNVVLPQREVIPENAVYRKLSDGQWFTFIEDDRNWVSSAQGEPGYCPPAGSPHFRPGLNAGDWCVQLTIEDGGANDDDGIVNRMVVDPGGVAVLGAREITTRGGGGAFGLWGLLLLALGALRLPAGRFRGSFTSVLGLLLVPFMAQAQEKPNTTPVASDDVAVVAAGGAVVIPVLDNDQDADGDSLTIVAGEAEHGQVTIVDGRSIRYRPAPDFRGEDLVYYTVYDGRGRLPKGFAPSESMDVGDQCVASGLCTISEEGMATLRLHINFARDDARVENRYLPEIEKLATLMKKAPEGAVVIEGHTSAVGSDAYNQRLSERRAKSVARILVERFGVDAEKVKAIGYGESRLLDKAYTREAHAVNRRIEAAFTTSFKKSRETTSGIASAKVTVTVAKPNTPPVAIADQVTVEEGASVEIDVLANDRDADGDELTVTAVTAEHGSATILDKGVIRYTPEPGYHGAVELSYMIEDGRGASAKAPVSVQVPARAMSWYLWGDVAAAKGSSSKGDLNSELQDAGLNATTTALDTRRTAYQLGLGTKLDDHWAVELGYADLGEVEMGLTATTSNPSQLYAAVQTIHPLSAKGYQLAVQYQQPVSESIRLFARLGYWRWDARYTTNDGVKVGSDKGDGSDKLFGLGALFDLGDQVGLRLMWQRYYVDSEQVNMAGVGLVYPLY